METIIAQCTPKGSGAIALLRLSGCHAVTIATQISKLPGNKQLADLPTHTIHYGRVVDHQGNHLDQVMFLLMRGPSTFTGEDVVEITCHNNPFIIEAIIQRALACNARLAKEGEFTRRAVENEKLDLVQAEALHELIHANTHLALKKSLAQLEGSLSAWVELLEKDLYKMLAYCEASFEFIDEEHLEFGSQIGATADELLATIATLKHTFDAQQQIRQGIRIALIGSVNAGKSSLFNALLKKERAIVTNIAGTTRDSIEAGIYRGSSYWTLIDTAGIRQTNDIIEQAGIKRSFEEAHQADIVLLVVDRTQVMSQEAHMAYQQLFDQYEHKMIVVYAKADLSDKAITSFALSHDTNAIKVSSTANINIAQLEQTIDQKIDCLLKAADAPFLLNQRQFKLVISLEQKLQDIKKMLVAPVAYELVSVHIRQGLEHLSEFTGRTVSERGMDAVFREFCVGK